jgi:DNA-binding transcriptional regulator LsrR (DeoR family)
MRVERSDAKHERNARMRLLYEQGWPQAKLARRFRVSRQRVHQIIRKAAS